MFFIFFISEEHFSRALEEKLREISHSKGGTVSEELVKFIPNFCDALFEIVDHYPKYDGLVFDALVSLYSCRNLCSCFGVFD